MNYLSENLSFTINQNDLKSSIYKLSFTFDLISVRDVLIIVILNLIRYRVRGI
jgi:hypothetical protein